MRYRERGAALLEVLAAIVILAIAGLALVELLGGETRALSGAIALERELADEERLLAAYALLSRTDLDRRVGATETGPYHVGIQRPERALYRIAVGRTAAPGVEDLVTVVFRPEPRDAP
ncbi:MAG: type II secretion system protein [Gemmatimonadota bacterium]